MTSSTTTPMVTGVRMCICVPGCRLKTDTAAMVALQGSRVPRFQGSRVQRVRGSRFHVGWGRGNSCDCSPRPCAQRQRSFAWRQNIAAHSTGRSRWIGGCSVISDSVINSPTLRRPAPGISLKALVDFGRARTRNSCEGPRDRWHLAWQPSRIEPTPRPRRRQPARLATLQ
jgi:hypothetical protein